jgi:hypothetical protein
MIKEKSPISASEAVSALQDIQATQNDIQSRAIQPWWYYAVMGCLMGLLITSSVADRRELDIISLIGMVLLFGARKDSLQSMFAEITWLQGGLVLLVMFSSFFGAIYLGQVLTPQFGLNNAAWLAGGIYALGFFLLGLVERFIQHRYIEARRV